MFTIGSWVLISVGVILVVMIFSLFHRLKSRHPEVYRALGSPKIYQRRSVWVTLMFLTRRDYIKLQDQSLALLCNFIIGLLVLYGSVLLGMLTVFRHG